MYFTATIPYLFMFALLIRAVTLEGANNGLSFYITPNWTKLTELAVSEVTLGCATAPLMVVASFGSI